MIKLFSKGMDTACKTLFFMGGVCLFVAAFIVSYDVFMRYVFIKPTSWANDFVEYALLYSTFLSAAWLTRNDWHIKLTAVYDMFSDKARLALDIFNATLIFAVIVFFFWYALTDTINAYQKGILIVRPVTVDKWIIQMAMPIGYFALLVVLLRNLVGSVMKIRTVFAANTVRGSK
ncbi:MAG: TRAP transporter small permease [Rhodospirillales bacterium]|nr:TRAP transporter small permease [Rhodospirillales bacterium]